MSDMAWVVEWRGEEIPVTRRPGCRFVDVLGLAESLTDYPVESAGCYGVPLEKLAVGEGSILTVCLKRNLGESRRELHYRVRRVV